MTSQDTTSELVRACAASELPPGEIRRVPTNPPIAVYNLDGEFYATADLCTHGLSSLSEDGYLEDGEIECGWHLARFCVRTGAVKAPPASVPLATYAVRVVDGDLYVSVPPPGAPAR
ncbi:bifunctional 3-phenylpropionate/cinnamic acid dioxygenase ferredoxin subunit [Actinomadura chibensis]|uniref:Bifunctional 3-phenylpropionate/cinnamic acid dioxygenase ferredoxin subunit n=1 Tax=Actinomadura chibensis TaxID=392828 RepID=A0A5D0N993_9ACTN|nr:bifunctional 3-phenylpropionate/cinnamic acid dioxygenase ferredoxin subunit [Actinomadura chibensis]TYB41064.1 bifunctional 3-phenylpropionate/cinnamic acid dioxygenase ferredoxin subunit [Actinomadura chibensis]